VKRIFSFLIPFERAGAFYSNGVCLLIQFVLLILRDGKIHLFGISKFADSEFPIWRTNMKNSCTTIFILLNAGHLNSVGFHFVQLSLSCAA
jgi:hypothetical protein